MSSRYTLVLRSCAPDGQAHVAQFLGKAFNLKDSTCSTIAGSAPIALLADLAPEEASVLRMLLGGIQHAGVEVEYTVASTDDLPKIDWPRKPPIFKRELTEYVADFGQMAIACPSCSKQHSLLALLTGQLTGVHASEPNIGAPKVIIAQIVAPLPTVTISRPMAAPAPAPLRTPLPIAPPAPVAAPAPMRTPVPVAPLPVAPLPAPVAATPAREFKGSSLPEITPFSNQALPPSGSGSGARQAPLSATRTESDVHSEATARLNELFPEEEGGGAFMPNNNDITSILDKLLPDEEVSTSSRGGTDSSSRLHAVAASGYSLFLPKITDDGRRQKAVPLIAELTKCTPEEAEILSKKVIIPVLKGVNKDEAEAGKQRFAKIGILGRVKGAGER